MADSRPDPSELLARIRRQEARAEAPAAGDSAAARRGKLKIFLGMCPGVGKTYAMLAAAQRLAAQGPDVAIGIVETHGRSETEQMTLGLDLIARRSVSYRGPDGNGAAVTLHEFDLDAALARRPDVLLIDELAHTNAPGSASEKRWQDVQACLSAGINVYSTLNVQHIESCSDIVTQITGVAIRETVPDSVVEQADEIELVDLPPNALLERLHAGKVYLPETARQATDAQGGFFRLGNLTALRQLALRRTAEWVDQRMREYKEDHGIRAVWPAAERVLVAVSPSPTSANLVRAAKRVAAGLRAQLFAIYAETPAAASLSPANRDRVMQTLRLAESLGAQTATITASGSSHAAAELVSYARARNINRIFVGKTLHSPLREAWLMLSGRGSFIRDLIRASGEIEVTVLSGEADADPALAPAPASGDTQVATDVPRQPVGRTVRSYLASLGLVAGCTGISALLFQRLDLANVVMLYLAGVVVAAMWLGRGPAVVATVLGVAAFDFVFVPPHLTFAVSDVQYLITFAVMLFVGVLISHLAARLRAMAESARDRERRTASLYAIARELAAAQSLTQVYTVATQHLAAAFEADVILAAASPAAGEGVDVLSSAGGTPDWLDAPGSPDRSVARWVLDHGRTAGFGTRTLPAAAGRFIPLATPQGGQGRLGVIGLRPRSPDAASRMLSADRLLLLDTFAGQVAAAVERIGLIDSRQSARLEVETERLRSALLSSVSHDLRTPLTAIAGAASTLRESGDQLASATRAELVDSIVTESQRLNELIANLVFATRLESGAIELARQWTTIEEIVGSGLAAHRDALSRRTVRILGLSGLPMVNVDNAMLPMVIHNLVENALRYSPAGSPITITGWAADNTITLKIADEGPGLAEGELARVFQRFYRGRTARTPESASARGGMGLGLTICQGIIRAHGGRIWAEPNTPAGAAFLFSLPLTEPQPDLAAEAAEPVSSLAASAAAAPTAGGRA